MSLWGNDDSVAITGTVTVAGTALTGATSLVTDGLEVGNTIITSDNANEYLIVGDLTETTATVKVLKGGDQTTLAAYGSQKPKFDPNYPMEDVFGADANEVTVDGGKIAHTGWVQITNGSGDRAGRRQTEVLVAGGISSTASTADDTVLPDA